MPDGTTPLIETARRDDPDRIERQLAMLDALAAAGVQAAREVGRQAEAGQTSAAEISLAYARVSRAVRLAILLQTQLVEGAETREARIRKATEDAEDFKAHSIKCSAGNIIDRVASEAHPHDEAEVDRLVREADERLDDPDLYGDMLERPMSEIVARLCKDLGLTPDWTRLAEELWAQDEIDSGEVGAPLAAFNRTRPPPLAGEVAQRAGGGIPPPLRSNSAVFTDSA